MPKKVTIKVAEITVRIADISMVYVVKDGDGYGAFKTVVVTRAGGRSVEQHGTQNACEALRDSIVSLMEEQG